MTASRARSMAVAALLAWWAASLAAQAPGEGLTLDEVLQLALDRAASVQQAARELDLKRGMLLAAAEPFDAQIQASLSGNRQNEFTSIGALPAARTDSVVYGASLQKRLRSGIVISPEVRVTGASSLQQSLGMPQQARLGFGQSVVKLGLLVPLKKDRGGVITSASERAAVHDQEASTLRLRHTQAESVLTAAAAYWEYAAAQARLDVYVLGEARAARMVDETRALVEADERTSADLTQVVGNLAAQRAARISAKQEVVEAWQQLAIAAGLTIEEARQARPAVTAFPPATESAGAEVDRLVAQARLLRLDLAATERDADAAEVLMVSALRDLDERFDLVVNAGYQGQSIGNGINRLVSPLFGNVPGFDATVEFRYELPAARIGARGRVLQQSAVQASRQIARADLARQIGIQVVAAAAARENSQAVLAAARDAVDKLDTSVQNEARKFRLGMSTLFDVLQAEQELTEARLAVIGGHLSHAIAIAAIRFQIGGLLQFADDRPLVRVEALLTPP